MNDLPLLSLAEASRALDRGEVSALELLDAVIERAERLNPRINAFLRIDADGARAAARRADAERASGQRRGPLHGIPMAHKDMFYRSGVASSCGANVKLPAATASATALLRLDAAGAVQFGVLNMTEFAFGPTGHNQTFGDCRNPWNIACITGGSSSGSAATVAARANFAALGSDTGASVRLPACLNGITGLKTSYGRVSRAGAMGLSFSLDTVGPLARSAYDCALVLNAIAGPDPLDPTTAAHDAPDHVRGIEDPVRGLRVGVPTSYFNDKVDPRIEAVLRQSLATLQGLGCVLVPVDPGDMAAANAAGALITAAEAASFHGNLLREQADLYSPRVRKRIERGFAVSAPQYLDALRYRAVALARFSESVFSRVDVLHAPVLPIATPRIDPSAALDDAAWDAMLAELTRFSRPFNYLGLPSLALPAGFLDDGLPTGMQLIARPFAEALLLRLGHAYQNATDWHMRQPGGIDD
jgi:aspartyl-tRNA(Asn)/glutamyl-tRNA(Gln) amidotransferase subunit A